MEKVLLLTFVFLMMLGSSHGRCSNVRTRFQTNLRTLLNQLTKNAPLHDGFYETRVGNDSDRVYGMAQCKANISSNDCAKCLSYYHEDACPESTDEASISDFCTLKFSNKNFFGVWDNTSSATYGENGLDDALVFSRGFSMMEELVSTVPEQSLMYHARDIDVGEEGKRYGLAQCSRDLSKSNCSNCLNDQLVRYRSYVENRTGWQMLGVSCSMWYANVSVTDAPGLTAMSPSDSISPPGGPTITSGAHRCHGGSIIGTLMLLAIRVWCFTS